MVEARQRKAIRWMSGALFTLPFADGDGDLSAFITDWSPFPAACAVAVHPDHPVLGAQERQARPYFAGRFVRHPLTGDLLPMWVADWVKPEFGTGVVIVNPAHSAVDLDFARAVGLPVRFGLAERPPTVDEKTWPEPPIVKSGVAVRTGRFDGLDATTAAGAYREDLTGAGFATPAKVPVAGRHDLGELAPAGEAEVRYDAVRRRWGAGSAMRLTPGPALDLVAALAHGSTVEVLATPDAVPRELLWVRLLLADLGETGSTGRARVRLVQHVDLGKTGADAVPDAALAVCGAPDAVVAVKPQQVEQVERLIADATSDRAAGRPGPGAPSAAGRKALDALGAGDLAAAFTHVYALYRTLKRDEAVGDGDPAAYAVTAHVLLGTPLPDWLPTDAAAELMPSPRRQHPPAISRA